MTSTLTLKGVSLSPQENTFVQAAKHRLIDTLMFAGIRYAPIGFISGLLNQTIHKLGPGEEKIIPVDGNFDIIKSDAVDMRLHVEHFIERLAQEKINPDAVATFQEIIEQGIAVMEGNHHRLTAAYLAASRLSSTL